MTTVTNIKAVRIEQEDGEPVAYIELENGQTFAPFRVGNPTPKSQLSESKDEIQPRGV